MSSATRASVVSSFTIVKGALIEETYAVFAAWDLERTKRWNLDRLRRENFIGASSAAMLRDIAKVLNRRFEPSGRDRALVILARGGCSMEEWRPLLLWHMTRDEFLLRDWLVRWLFSAYEEGVLRVHPRDLETYLQTLPKSGGQVEHDWSERTAQRVANGLLKLATDFGLLAGRTVKSFASYHLPESSFLYLLHAMKDELRNPARVVQNPDWRMYLLRPESVEQELLRLHQFQKLEYQVAGSLVDLRLPCASAREFAERMVA
jgi:hypothetical protein